MHLNVRLVEDKDEKIRYSIVKDDGPLDPSGRLTRGFSQNLPAENPEKEIMRWTDISKKEALDVLKRAKDAPFTGNDFSDNVAIVQIDSKSMGYNWYIVKRQSRWDRHGHLRKI